MNAVVQSLARRGFSGTSTLSAQELADVSRGRLLHHFPSRQELLVASVKFVGQARLEALTATPVEDGNSDAVTLRRCLEVLWSIHHDDLFWAAMELWLGARNDPSLRTVLITEERALGKVAREVFDDLMGTRFTSRPGYAELRDTLIASMRGVALLYSFDDRRVAAKEPHLDSWFALACRVLEVSED
jgi:AcrR family transcriptional regulator